MHISIMLVFWSLVRNSVVLAVYFLFSVTCFFTVHEHFIKEYHFKLSKVYDKFYTKEAFSIAQKRKKLTESFYEELIREIDMQKICSIIDI